MFVFGLGVLAAAIFGAYRLWEIGQRPVETEWTRYTDNLFAQYRSGQESARARWQAAEIQQYRLSIRRAIPYQDPAMPGSCQQVIEVQDEQVVGVEKDTCPDAANLFSPAGDTYPLTVSAWLGQIERDTAEIVWSEQGVGCSFLLVDAAYDQTAGFPTYILYHWETPPGGLGFPIEAQYFPAGAETPSGECAAIQPMDGPEITIRVEPVD